MRMGRLPKRSDVTVCLVQSTIERAAWHMARTVGAPCGERWRELVRLCSASYIMEFAGAAEQSLAALASQMNPFDLHSAGLP
jgi:hypothetical protein